MSDIQLEPVAPSVEFVGKNRRTVAGESDPRTTDYAAWQKDMADRIQRSADLSVKRREAMAKKDINIVEVIDVELIALEAGAQDFEATHLKPNTALLDKRAQVAELESRLSVARQELEAIEARGSSVDRLYAAVTTAESALNGMVRAAEAEALNKLIVNKFGWLAPRHKITPETLKELNLDISIQKLKEFAIQLHRQRTEDPQVLQQRMDAVGRKLSALRDYLEPETA